MLDLDWSNPETFWLNLMNAALGIATLVALMTLMGAVVVELYDRVKKRVAAGSPDFHSLHVPDLGLTMTDGGEKIDETNTPSSGDQTSSERRR